jgi:hypothetical protein
MAVDVAYDGVAGHEKATVLRYDVVVLDRDLPGMSGDELCRRLLHQQALTRVLMTTRHPADARLTGSRPVVPARISQPRRLSGRSCWQGGSRRSTSADERPVRGGGPSRVLAARSVRCFANCLVLATCGYGTAIDACWFGFQVIVETPRADFMIAVGVGLSTLGTAGCGRWELLVPEREL